MAIMRSRLWRELAKRQVLIEIRRCSASAHALADGILAWRDGGDSLESLLEEAVTPRGIAAATTTAMDAAGYGRAVRQGVAAGLRRARANAGK